MSNYRRKQQIHDDDIDAFKSMEIEKIKSNVNTSSRFSRPIKTLFIVANGIAVIVIALIIGGVFSGSNHPGNGNQLYTFERFSDDIYHLESKEEGFEFSLYYGIDIVHLGERTSYNSLFDYQVFYEYPNQDIVDSFDHQLDVYKHAPYLYFLKAEVNGEATYLEVNYFKDAREDHTLDALTIDNFEDDLKAMMTLLETYPPVLSNEGVYLPHEDLNDLADSTAKDNYLTYIANYYEEENTYTEEDISTQPGTRTIYKNHVVIVDDDGDIEDKRFDTSMVYGDTNTDPTDILERPYNDYLTFYPVDRSSPYQGFGSVDYASYSNDVDGWFKTTLYDNRDLYIYSAIYLEDNESLKDTDYVTVDYHINDGFNDEQDVLTISPFIYNNALIIPPTYIDVIIIERYIEFHDVFEHIEIILYDERDTVLKTITLTHD